jgi:hypothetical protein
MIDFGSRRTASLVARLRAAAFGHVVGYSGIMRAVLAVVLLYAGAAAAGDFEFPEFASTHGLFLVVNAHRTKKVLRLTGAWDFQVGAAWFRVKQPVSGGFDTTFTFQLTDQDRGHGGADGLAFVVQNDDKKARGGYGASAGFMRSDIGAPGGFERGIVRRLAVFFDTFENRWDASDNSVAICTNGAVANMSWPPRCLAYSERLPVNLKDGRQHVARITYEPPRLSIYLDGLAMRVGAVDLASIVGGDGSAWVGFTAATGGGHENHDILSWKFQSGPSTSATSTISVVDSTISYKPFACLPNRTLCTPEQAVVQDKGLGLYHVYLPAQLEWGASVPNPDAAPVRVFNVTGTICWDTRLRNASGCNGPAGNGIIPGMDAEGGAEFVASQKPTGSLVAQTLNGRTWFTVNDRMGEGFKDNEGYFEFDVAVAQR